MTIQSLPYAANYVEYSDSLVNPSWQVLTNFVGGSMTQAVNVPIGLATPQRFFRLRFDRPPPFWQP